MIYNAKPTVSVTHLPTGVKVTVEVYRKSQRKAYDQAMTILKSKLFYLYGQVKDEDVVEETYVPN